MHASAVIPSVHVGSSLPSSWSPSVVDPRRGARIPMGSRDSLRVLKATHVHILDTAHGDAPTHHVAIMVAIFIFVVVARSHLPESVSAV